MYLCGKINQADMMEDRVESFKFDTGILHKQQSDYVMISYDIIILNYLTETVNLSTEIYL